MTTIESQYHRLFTRKPDQTFSTFDDLFTQTLQDKDRSDVRWTPPANMVVTVHQDRLKLKITGDRAYDLTDWSFSQLCNFVRADRKIIERLKPETAAQVLSEIFPFGDRPLQIFTTDTSAHSLHRISYERLFDADVLDVVLDEAEHLTGNSNEASKTTTFFRSDRDMHAFLVDASAWTHYWGEKFAPAFMVWNSEVGARSVGIRAGWYHAGTNGFVLSSESCELSYSRRHSRGVNKALSKIRERIQLWLESADDQSDSLMRTLTSARAESFASTTSTLHRKLIALGLSLDHGKSVDKWLLTAGRSFSRLDVAIAITAVACMLPFASSRFDLGHAAGKILGLSHEETNVVPLNNK